MPGAVQSSVREQQDRQRRKASTIIGVSATGVVICILWFVVNTIQSDTARAARTADQLKQLPRSQWAQGLANERSPGQMLELLGDGYVFNLINSTPRVQDRDGKPLETIWVISGERPFQIEQYRRVHSPPERP